MDPIGFGLENYDASGKWRDSEVMVNRVWHYHLRKVAGAGRAGLG